MIGSGSFSHVEQVWDKVEGQQYAAKIIQMKGQSEQDDDKSNMMIQQQSREFDIIMQYIGNHHNVIHMIQRLIGEKYTYIIMEYANCGDLLDLCNLLGSVPSVSEDDTNISDNESKKEQDLDYIKKLFISEPSEVELIIKAIFYQILSAVAFIHKKGVIHRDIKPDNILLKQGNLSDNINKYILNSQSSIIRTVSFETKHITPLTATDKLVPYQFSPFSLLPSQTNDLDSFSLMKPPNIKSPLKRKRDEIQLDQNEIDSEEEIQRKRRRLDEDLKQQEQYQITFNPIVINQTNKQLKDIQNIDQLNKSIPDQNDKTTPIQSLYTKSKNKKSQINLKGITVLNGSVIFYNENLRKHQELIPILSDFGFSRIVSLHLSQHNSDYVFNNEQHDEVSPELIPFIGMESQTLCGTPDYISPELLSMNSKENKIEEEQSEEDILKQDVWSLGILLYYMFFGHTAKNQVVQIHNITQLISGHIPQSECDIPYWLRGITYDAVRLLGRMLTPSPSDRISSAQALDHEWFNSLKEKVQIQ